MDVVSVLRHNVQDLGLLYEVASYHNEVFV